MDGLIVYTYIPAGQKTDKPPFVPTSHTKETVRISLDNGVIQLTVHDSHGNSTGGRHLFTYCDSRPQNEVLSATDKERFNSLIGKVFKEQYRATRGDQPLSESELEDLDEFLLEEGILDERMDLSTLDGFLTAFAICPCEFGEDEWLPWVWDMEDGKAQPKFSSEAEVSYIFSLLTRHYNSIVETFNTNPAAFDPIFWRGEVWGASEWCEGFIKGCGHVGHARHHLTGPHPAWFEGLASYRTLDACIGREHAKEWMNAVTPAVLGLHASWKEQASS